MSGFHDSEVGPHGAKESTYMLIIPRLLRLNTNLCMLSNRLSDRYYIYSCRLLFDVCIANSILKSPAAPPDVVVDDAVDGTAVELSSSGPD